MFSGGGWLSERACERSAMAMPLAERKSRHNALFAALLRNDISKWGDKFLSALMGTKEFRLKDGAATSRTKFQGVPTRH